MAAGLDAGFNPFWKLLDPSELGLAGHSYGAAGVSYIGQWDPRVKAIVAWDNLGGPGPDDSPVPGAAPGAPSQTIGESASSCPADPADRTTVPITKPALGMSADYGLPPAPNTSLPDPDGKSTWSLNYSKAGVDTGEIVIRGGSHLDFSFIPNQAFGASLRGPDLIAWYTTAWFDKYLKHSPDADAELLTQRWRDDPIEASIDPNHDGNAFSFYYYSRLDIHLSNGQVWDCEDLRDGCPGCPPATGIRARTRTSRSTRARTRHRAGRAVEALEHSVCVHRAPTDHHQTAPLPRPADRQGAGVRRRAARRALPRPRAGVGQDPGDPGRLAAPASHLRVHGQRAGQAAYAEGVGLRARRLSAPAARRHGVNDGAAVEI